MTSKKLKPCPFCGNDAADISTVRECEMCMNVEDCPEYQHTDECHLYFAICNVHKGGCGASGAIKNTPEAAAEWWNQRRGEQP